MWNARLIDADASNESLIKGVPELVAALKRAYRATESNWKRQVRQRVTRW